jgi:hypothetical protein
MKRRIIVSASPQKHLSGGSVYSPSLNAQSVTYKTASVSGLNIAFAKPATPPAPSSFFCMAGRRPRTNIAN